MSYRIIFILSYIDHIISYLDMTRAIRKSWLMSFGLKSVKTTEAHIEKKKSRMKGTKSQGYANSVVQIAIKSNKKNRLRP